MISAGNRGVVCELFLRELGQGEDLLLSPVINPSVSSEVPLRGENELLITHRPEAKRDELISHTHGYTV